MLKRAVSDDIQSIEKICSDSIIGTKILSQISAYGLERDFLEVWIMLSDGSLQAVLTKFYDDAAVLTTDDADTEQLKVFLEMFSFNSLMCSCELCEKSGINDYIIKKGYRYDGNCIETITTDCLTEDDMHDAYNLISREIPGSFKEGRDAYLSFLSDYTFRERRGLARGVCTHFSGKLTSVAVTSAETKNGALISGVACDRTLQKRGIGKSTVLSIASTIIGDGKIPYVIALNESAEGFYEHIGFIFKEKIAFVERKKDV